MANPLSPPLGKTFWKLLGFWEQLELLEVLWAGGPLLSGFWSQCVAKLPVTSGETELFFGRVEGDVSCRKIPEILTLL